MRKLSCNMGTTDRVIRGVLAASFIALVTLTDHLADAPFIAIGGTAFALLNIFAATTAFCPMYRFTGSDTRPKRS